MKQTNFNQETFHKTLQIKVYFEMRRSRLMQ